MIQGYVDMLLTINCEMYLKNAFLKKLSKKFNCEIYPSK